VSVPLTADPDAFRESSEFGLGVNKPKSVRAADWVVHNLSCPRVIMRFRLVYHGRLPATGNSSKKPDKVRDIRDQFHPQLKFLWESHAALKRLKQTSIVSTHPGADLGLDDSPFRAPRDLTQFPMRDYETDLCAPIPANGKSYIPLIRQSLALNCHLGILFLRQEDPGDLVLQGGDVDNRIKTLFDALRIPDPDSVGKYPQNADPLFCLLESDTLISGFDVDTDRLLFAKTDEESEAYLVIEVTIRVLKIGPWNMSLIGL
jgi:hypothetical protein